MVLAWVLAVEPTGEVEAPDAEALETATHEELAEAAVEPEAPRPVQPPRFIEPHWIRRLGIDAEHATLGWLPRGVLQPTSEGLGLGNGLWFDNQPAGGIE